MKILSTLFTMAVLATSVVAGPAYSSKNAKGPVAPLPPAGCTAFEPGAAVDIFGAGIISNSGGEDALGGGVGLNYFFTRNLGIDLNYSLFATDSEHHQFDGNLVLRFPIDSVCIAPYILGGGGGSTNGTSEGNWQAGAGIDIRFASSSNIGIFAEGSYHWAANDDEYTIVRLGVRIPF